MGNYAMVDNVYNEMILQKALKDRTLVFNEDVDTQSIYKLDYYMDKIKKIDDMNNTPKKDRKITIEISSGGGSCVSGFFICGKIEKFQKDYGYTIITRINEIGASMAFLMFIMGDIREMYKYSEVMFHQPLSAYFDFEKMQDTEDRLKNITVSWNRFKKICSERTKMTDEQMELCKREKKDWWMDAEEALALNVATKII